MDKICILIPAYNPDEKLLYLVENLKEILPQAVIIVVNDGSVSDEIFSNLKSLKTPPDNILTHAVNMGKGETLKSGFKFILQNYSDCFGVVTADCDLQHSVDDIVKLFREFENNPDNIYFGTRFSDKVHVPIKSLIGNFLASFLLRITHRIKIKDSQTGLRAIPTTFLNLLIQNNLSDFSFETYMLIMANKYKIPVVEIPIKTIYINNNKNTNFKPLIDSYRIFKTVLREF